MELQATSADFFAQQNIETTPQIRSQTDVDEYDFSIARAFVLLMAVLVIPLNLSLLMLNYSFSAMI